MIRRPGVHGRSAVDPGTHRERGQATVEIALLLPVIVVVALAVIQVGLIVHARVMVTHASREGVRVAAVGGDDRAVAQAAMVAGELNPARVTVTVDRAGGRATVTVNYRAATTVPIVGAVLDDVALTATATMRLE